MAEWSEIEKLQADFQRAQHTVTTQRLSERNCIEILVKLQEMKLLNVLHTADGKEYLTPNHLLREIRDEIYVRGGRVNVVDIQESLNIDLSHIEVKCNELVKSDNSVQLVYGQLIERYYLDQLAEEVNDNLQSSGQVTIGELSKQYDLPGDFLLPELISRIGTLIKGQTDAHKNDTIFTEDYLARHKARIRGILSAVTRPITVQALSSGQELSVNLLFTIVEELIKEGRIRGQMAGGRSEKSTFLPAIHTQTQNVWIDNFYKHNNYIEYDSILRLGINEPKSYLKRRLSGNSLLFLKTVCVGQGIVDQATAVVDETISNHEWADITTVLPSSFSCEDVNQLLHHILLDKRKHKTSSGNEAVIFADTFVTSQMFVDSCLKYFDNLMKEKADKEAKKASVFALTEEERKEYMSHTSADDPQKKVDKKDDRRKKANEGSGSVKRGSERGGGGSGAREVKTKGKDKTRLKWKKEQETQMESATKPRQGEATFMQVDEIEEVLKKQITDAPDDFIEEIAVKLLRPLSTKYQTVVKSVFLLSSQQLKQESKKFGEVAGSEKLSQKSRRQAEEEVNVLWTNARLFSESFKFFEDDALATIQKHLLKTICTDIANALFYMMASEFLFEVEIASTMTSETRIKLLGRLPAKMKPALTRLNNSVSGKSFDAFSEAVTEAASPSVCDVMLKHADKKKNRHTIHSHKMSYIQQIKSESDPALVLHLVVSVIFQTITGHMLNAPGKLVPNIIERLQQSLERDVFIKLLNYQELVLKSLSLSAKTDCGDVLELVEQQLNGGLEEIKNLASSTKKKQASS